MLLTETLCRLSPSLGRRYRGGRGRKHEERLGLHLLHGAVSGPWGIISTVLCDYLSSCKYSSLKEKLTLLPPLPPPTAARVDKVAEEAASRGFFLPRKKAVCGDAYFMTKTISCQPLATLRLPACHSPLSPTQQHLSPGPKITFVGWR